MLEKGIDSGVLPVISSALSDSIVEPESTFVLMSIVSP
jgi:hypothetical protein